VHSCFVMTVCHFGRKYSHYSPRPCHASPSLRTNLHSLPTRSQYSHRVFTSLILQITVLAQGLYLSYTTDHSSRTGSLPLHCAIFQGIWRPTTNTTSLQPRREFLFGFRGLYSCSVVLFWSTDLGRAAVELVAARRLDGIIDTRAPLQLLGTVNGVAVLVPNKRTNRHEDIPGPPQQHKKTDTKR